VGQTEVHVFLGAVDLETPAARTPAVLPEHTPCGSTRAKRSISPRDRNRS
jgi:hypothetical protein